MPPQARPSVRAVLEARQAGIWDLTQVCLKAVLDQLILFCTGSYFRLLFSCRARAGQKYRPIFPPLTGRQDWILQSLLKMTPFLWKKGSSEIASRAWRCLVGTLQGLVDPSTSKMIKNKPLDMHVVAAAAPPLKPAAATTADPVFLASFRNACMLSVRQDQVTHAPCGLERGWCSRLPRPAFPARR